MELLYTTLINNKESFNLIEQHFHNSRKKTKMNYTFSKKFSSMKLNNLLPIEYHLIVQDFEINKPLINNTILTKEYIEELRPKINSESIEERKTVRILQYVHVCTLKTGDSFGDSSFINSNMKM